MDPCNYENTPNLNLSLMEPYKPEKIIQTINVTHYNTIYKTTKIITTDVNSIWSGYHRMYTPLTNNPKGIIFRINNDEKTITIVSNTLDNYFDDILNIDDIFVIFKLN